MYQYSSLLALNEWLISIKWISEKAFIIYFLKWPEVETHIISEKVVLKYFQKGKEEDAPILDAKGLLKSGHDVFWCGHGRGRIDTPADCKESLLRQANTRLWEWAQGVI